MIGKILLKTNELAVGYGKKEKPLHNNINIHVNEGEFICLLGPNGAGKSTLIRTLSGFQPPCEGKIFFGERQLAEINEAQRAKLVSVVLTDRLMVQNLTVFELVALGRTPYTGFFGKLSDEDIQKVNSAIKQVGLEDFSYKAIDKMSDGERQKAMIAKAIVQETPFIILDEPTAFLDLPAKLEIMQLLRRLSRDNNKGILLSTHDLEMALQIADKIWLLAQGKKLETGIPEDLVLLNKFKEFFEREGVVFDNVSGSFKYHIHNKKPINLQVNCNTSRWIERALNRNGYSATQEECNYSVRVLNNGTMRIQFYQQDKFVAEFDTIQKLMDKVKVEYR